MKLSDWKAVDVAKRLSRSGIGKSRPSSGGWLAPCPAHDDRTPSLSLNDSSDGRLLWNCFAGCTSEDVRKALVDALDGEDAPEASDQSDRVREKVESPWTVVSPVPSSVAVTIDDFVHHLHGAPSRVWTYRTAEGEIAGWTARYELGEGAKDVIPWTWQRNESTNVEEMRMKAMPEPRPLYNLDKITMHPDAVILLNEGEKAADASAPLFPDWIPTAIPGGSNSVRFADLSPLAGRRVVLLADHDAPGYDFAMKIAESVPEDVDLRLVAWPERWPAARGGEPYHIGKGWDAYDHVREGWTRDLLKEFVKETEATLFHRIRLLDAPLELRYYHDDRPS